MDASTRPRAVDLADLSEVRRRRAELRETMAALEVAIAAPAADALAWFDRARLAAAELAAEFVDHIEVTEGPDGLHQSILAGDLRLANAVEALSTDHAAITEQIAALIERIDGARATPGTDPAAVREHATALLVHLHRHRQRGADLIYEAFQTDLGGGD